MLTQESN